ncbi:dolichyl-diphosphooligosaccharide--protein glycosyltransferase subunit 1 [Puccinia graminis f. sp. tritici]|uniref:Dolichyl-diphosphooligosaccharide--protein glycosyltransferase subunit 1 n=1 Tax=Puccinia graminis f. sp. tritici TaxID=56615 RepID=A0A5B0MGS6_PUCGR|nr:dolichyl-diphosphooligosaccharide--protein glycosyltransferase subunit 1 [Puccinia graminis f. sp. tritici]
MRWKQLSLATIGLSASSWLASVSSDQVVLDLPQFAVPSSLPARVTNYLRTIDISGTITREQLILHLRRTQHDSMNWYLPVEPHRAANLSSMEIYEGKANKTGGPGNRGLKIEPMGYDSGKEIHVIEVEWPHPDNDEAVITINSHFLGLTSPRPKYLAQDEGAKQGLYWEGDLLAGFGALKGTLTDDAEVKIKVKTPTPRVIQKHAPSGFDVQQTSGSNQVTFTSKIDGSKLSDEPQVAHVHYFQPFPLMVIGNLTRLVEVSHWGNNVAIEDQIHLENRGPTLKGSFSRVVHHNAIYARAPGATAHILTGLTLELPQGAMNPYYIDTIGNVSTSRFRPSMPSTATIGKNQPKFKKIKEAKSSKLELTPRYPIAGGWNYTFTVGYNLEAGRLLKIHEPGQYILKVPFFTNALDVPIDLANLRVRLPEGAFNIEVYTPFPVTELQDDLIEKTYLDTTGRPTISIKKLRCTEKHAEDIYITYFRPPIISLQKPLAIAGWMMTLFVIAAGFRRFEWKIGHH